MLYPAYPMSIFAGKSMTHSGVLTCHQLSSKLVLVTHKVNVRCLVHDERVFGLERVAPYERNKHRKRVRQYKTTPSHHTSQCSVSLARRLTESIRCCGCHVSPPNSLDCHLQPVVTLHVFVNVIDSLSRAAQESDMIHASPVRVGNAVKSRVLAC